MKFIIKTTNIQLTPPIEDYLSKKINALDKFVSSLVKKGVVMAKVEIGKTTKHHQKGDFFRTEININLPGEVIRAEAERSDLYLSIDEAKEEIQRQINKYKEKQIDVKKKKGRMIKES